VVEQEGDVYFVFSVIKHQTKITAIDKETGVEVSVIAPSHLKKDDMERLALRKLIYMKEKKHD
jgi:hypothetical protein